MCVKQRDLHFPVWLTGVCTALCNIAFKWAPINKQLHEKTTYQPQWLHCGEAFNFRFHSARQVRTGAGETYIHFPRAFRNTHTNVWRDTVRMNADHAYSNWRDICPCRLLDFNTIKMVIKWHWIINIEVIWRCNFCTKCNLRKCCFQLNILTSHWLISIGRALRLQNKGHGVDPQGTRKPINKGKDWMTVN